ncbi:MAG TPA: FAD-binding oxidoreductase [Alphaproteobacteria bacterium]|nr:FAD-binding oxidoreductase [Alphaproteobacteria bacterium]
MAAEARASYDVAIIGGGVIGCAVAYFLAADPGFDGTVAVIERDPSYEDCSTTRSAGSIRQQFSTPENIQMSLFGRAFLDSVGEALAVEGERPDIGFVERGYLFLASEATKAALEASHAIQKAHGADNVLLAPAEIEARFPWLSAEGVAVGSLGLSGEGWFDPASLLHAFRRKARSLGALYLRDEVTGIERTGGRVAALTMASGVRIACGAVVNAAGPRAGRVAALAGIDLPVTAKKRFVFVFDCREDLPGCPLVIDPAGVYFRPESGKFIGGVSPAPENDPDCFDLEVDYSWFDDRVWPRLAARVKAFEAVKMAGAWAGHYDYNTVDQNAVLGPHPETRNFFFANGFSGHGLQQSPAAGRATAELIVHGAYRTLDLGRFGYARFAAGEPVRELAVV